MDSLPSASPWQPFTLWVESSMLVRVWMERESLGGGSGGGGDGDGEEIGFVAS